MTKLNERAMLAALNISQWTARRLDKKITQEVAAQHGIDISAGNYNKCLLSGAGMDHLKAISKKANELRAYHYENTLPWFDNGARILPSQRFEEYHLTMLKGIEEFKDMVRDFAREYPSYKIQAQMDLNSLYRDNDYPISGADVGSRFSASVHFLPLPDGEDFRVLIADEHIDGIREDIQAQVKTATQDAMKDLWQRLYKPVKHMAETLHDTDKVFRDTLVSNVLDIVRILPDLNIDDDMDLESFRREVERELCDTDANDLRKDKEARADTARKAKDILDKMSGYVGASS